ncbi:MAG: DinB family protein [Nocardioides sp.]|nr:DinB family protein [Nocardioides sp.]
MSELRRSQQPEDGDERGITLGWLAFHRDALQAKCEGLSAEQLAYRSAEPSHLSLLGLVRHMTEMERAYGSWPLGDAPDFHWVWGAYEDAAEDDIDCTAGDAGVSFETWADERTKTDVALTRCSDLDTLSKVNHRSARWNLAKLVGEYARHNGHADIVRERIDGKTGE